MSIENIILGVIILVAGIYTGRKLYLFLFSKQPPKCTGCGGGCGKQLDDSKNSKCN